MVGSIMKTANSLMGTVAPIVTGSVVGKTGSFSGAFLVAAAVLVAGLCFYGLVLRRIEPEPDFAPPGGHRANKAVSA